MELFSMKIRCTFQLVSTSKGADSSSDEGVGQWQQEFVSGYIPKW